MNPCDRILRGFECVVYDEDFNINSPKAKCAIETAQSLMERRKRQRTCYIRRKVSWGTKGVLCVSASC